MKTDNPVEIDLSNTSTIPISIGTDIVNCLIDTGATINLMSNQYFKTNRSLTKLSVFNSKIMSAKIADGGKLSIIGCIYVPIVIAGKQFMVPFHVTQGLSCSVILGVHFLNAQNATIDFSRSKLKIYRKNQLRAPKQINIPARSQTIFYATPVFLGVLGNIHTYIHSGHLNSAATSRS